MSEKSNFKRNVAGFFNTNREVLCRKIVQVILAAAVILTNINPWHDSDETENSCKESLQRTYKIGGKSFRVSLLAIGSIIFVQTHLRQLFDNFQAI